LKKYGIFSLGIATAALLYFGYSYVQNYAFNKIRELTVSEYCQMLYDVPENIWNSLDPRDIKKVAKEIRDSNTYSEELMQSGERVAKAVDKVAEAIDKTYKSGNSSNLFGSLSNLGSLGLAVLDLTFAEASVEGCPNWQAPPTEIPT
jgi:hypothetical protein